MKSFWYIIIAIFLSSCTSRNHDKIEFEIENKFELINIVKIEAVLKTKIDIVFPMVESGYSKYNFEPYFHSFIFDTIKNKISIYNDFKKLDTNKLCTVIQIEYILNKKIKFYSEGYLYEMDTLNIPSYGASGKSAFTIINTRNKILIESNYPRIGNKIFVKYDIEEEYKKQQKTIIEGEYHFKIIKNIPFYCELDVGLRY